MYNSVICEVARYFTCSLTVIDVAFTIPEANLHAISRTTYWTYLTLKIIYYRYIQKFSKIQFKFCLILKTLLVWKLYTVLVSLIKFLHRSHFLTHGQGSTGDKIWPGPGIFRNSFAGAGAGILRMNLPGPGSRSSPAHDVQPPAGLPPSISLSVSPDWHIYMPVSNVACHWVSS